MPETGLCGRGHARGCGCAGAPPLNYDDDQEVLAADGGAHEIGLTLRRCQKMTQHEAHTNRLSHRHGILEGSCESLLLAFL